jgi:adenylosuccinate synthase
MTWLLIKLESRVKSELMNLDDLVEGKQVIAVTCNQWGDSGKGKIVDFFASWADLIVRGTGGDNAGHTIVLNDDKVIIHLIPSGILYDKQGKINIIGNGTVINPQILVKEMNMLDKANYSYDNLLISGEASLIMPYHIILDQVKDRLKGKKKIGTTERGIGPSYTEKVFRDGIKINDLFNKQAFRKKLELNLKKEIRTLKQVYGLTEKELKEILSGEKFEKGIYFNNGDFDLDAIIGKYAEYGAKFKRHVADTKLVVHESFLAGKKILLEGAQGLLLSVEHGTYPFVTSSDCSVNGLASGVGLPASEIDLSLGLVKTPYMTRVGNGPFPSEFGSRESEAYCATGITVKDELNKHGIPFKEVNGEVKYDSRHPKIIELMNSDNELEKGIGVRLAGGEYGATTGRPRRTGWLDLIALKYAVGINGRHIITTKSDVADPLTEIKLCVGYTFDGAPVFYNGLELKKGDLIDFFPTNSDILYQCKPVYQKLRGWKINTSNLTEFASLPEPMKAMIDFIEDFAGCKIAIVSTGPDRKQTIIRG